MFIFTFFIFLCQLQKKLIKADPASQHDQLFLLTVAATELPDVWA